MGELIVMRKQGEKDAGDMRQMWDPNNPGEVDAVRRQYDEFRAKGYLAYRVRPDSGEKGDQIHAFDPTAGKIIMSPPLRGG